MKKNKEKGLEKIAVFQGKNIRRVFHEGEWHFSIVDIIQVLSGTDNPRRYWSDLKRKVKKEGYVELYEKIVQLKFISSDGKRYMTDAGNVEMIFRLIQSIPSPKAEPFKRWLARVGKERLDEIADPQLAMERTRQIYEKKGYPKDWIDKRMRGIAVRQTLTKEWDERGIELSDEYAILTNEIMQGAFDMKVEDYKKHKGLKTENLRDHMEDMELILTMLGEATTTKITKDRDSKGFVKLKKDAKDGGAVAGRTRKDIEMQSGKKVITKKNYLEKPKEL